jgi:hypothetical protein
MKQKPDKLQASLQTYPERVNPLAEGFFGIYTQPDAVPQTRQNVRLLIPDLWDRLDEHTRQQFGIKYSRFIANNDQDKQKLLREFHQFKTEVQHLRVL